MREREKVKADDQRWGDGDPEGKVVASEDDGGDGNECAFEGEDDAEPHAGTTTLGGRSGRIGGREAAGMEGAKDGGGDERAGDQEREDNGPRRVSGPVEQGGESPREAEEGKDGGADGHAAKLGGGARIGHLYCEDTRDGGKNYGGVAMSGVSERFLVAYSAGVTVALEVLVLCGFAAATRKAQTFDEITVHRINIVEPDGTVRMVLSNKASAPGAFIKNKEYAHDTRQSAGLLFYDDEGTEDGGLIYGVERGSDGKVNGSNVHLSFDKYMQDQMFTVDA